MSEGFFDFLSTLQSHILEYALAAAAVGSLAMALLQTAKDLFPVRQRFQRRWLLNWLAKQILRASQASVSQGGEQVKPEDRTLRETTVASLSVLEVESELLRLAADGDADAFYNLSIEQLCGQMNSAVQLSLDYPNRYVRLFLTMTAFADPKDVDLMLAPPPRVRQLSGGPMTGVGREEQEEFLAARTRLGNQTHRAIDSIQISAGFRWKYWMQLSAIILSSAITWGALTWAVQEKNPFKTILLAILGGFVAPIARDLVVALKKWREN